MAATKRVAVIASGVSRWGPRPESTIWNLVVEAGKACFDSNKKVSNKDVEGIVTSAAYAERTGPQGHPAPLAAEVLGISPKLYQHTACQCQSGAVNIRIIWSAIVAGIIDIGMAVGFERMLIPVHAERYFNQGVGSDHDWESGFGLMPPAIFALAGRAHMEKYGTTEEQMAKVSVKNHTHSISNIAAHFRKGLTLDKAMSARVVASPFKLFDCCVNTDGAAAVILASEEKAKELTDNPVWIEGIGQGWTTGTMANTPRDLTDWSGVRISGERAYEMAGIGPDDIGVAELHDCFTISEMIEYEELGFCPRGESGKFVDEGLNDYGGKIVTQPRGGLIGCGHPLGATSIAQAHELRLQLRGEAGERQVNPIPKHGLSQTMSGVGSQSSVIIYGTD